MGTSLASNHATRARRAIGIVRVSQTKGREGERFVSPEEQRERIQAACARDGLTLLDVYEELDVSGGKTLVARPGLRAAVAAVQAGEADVVAAAYFDRLFRSLSTQSEVVERIERAGGQVLAVDVGHGTNGTAGQWLSGTMMGAVSEYFRRSAKERSADGQARAVARGATPWARVPLGYSRRDDGTLEVDPDSAAIAKQAFNMRADGASISQIRDMLHTHGVERSHRGVQVMLASRTYLGEIHFGEYVNPKAHDPIIARELWDRVQRMVVPRGRRTDSDRLLARLGILRCGSCGARLSAMKLPKQNDYPIYRCPSTSDCPRHVTISAVRIEDYITRVFLAGVRGVAAHGTRPAVELSELAEHARKAQERLDALIAMLDPLEPAARERLAQATQERDEAGAALERARERAGLTDELLNVALDEAEWERLSLEDRRRLLAAGLERVEVRSGRLPIEDRATVHWRGSVVRASG